MFSLSEKTLYENHRERKGKAGSLSHLTFYRDVSTMSVNQLLNNRQAQTSASGCTSTRRVCPVEPLKEIRQMFSGNAYPGIFNTYLPLLPNGPHAYVNRSSARRIFDRVAQ